MAQNTEKSGQRTFVSGAVKKFCVFAAKALICLAVCTALAVAALSMAYRTPLARIDENLAKSAQTFEREETYPKLFTWAYSRLDNFTDAIMLLTAANGGSGDTLKDALLNPRGNLSTQEEYASPSETLTRHYVDGREFVNIYTYPRYWHGYLLFLKPLLALFTYEQIRVINGAALSALAMLVVILMKRKAKRLIIPYLISSMMLMPIAIAYSLQFSSCCYAYTLSLIAVLMIHGTKYQTKLTTYVFLFTGIATAFFDLLTYPIATFGMPAVLLLSLRNDDSLKQKLSALIKAGLAWIIGYGGMWFGKLLTATLLTDRNVIKEAIDQFMTRTSAQSVDGSVTYSLFETLKMNLDTFFDNPARYAFYVYIAACFVLLALITVFMRKYIHIKPKRALSAAAELALYVLLSAAPLAFYSVALNHSTIHFWFTNKGCVVLVFALMCALTSAVYKLFNASREVTPEKRAPEEDLPVNG